MPLNSSHLHHSVIEILRDMPLDKESSSETTYQTKVELYDARCSNCGFARIELYNSDMYNAKPIKILRDANEAVHLAQRHGYRITRTCEYPFDINFRGNKPIYPTLTEIISNTCELWNPEKFISLENQEENLNIIVLINQMNDGEQQN